MLEVAETVFETVFFPEAVKLAEGLIVADTVLEGELLAD